MISRDLSQVVSAYHESRLKKDTHTL